jgi:hypothetical protein
MTEPAWRKSTYSDASGGDCVEVAVAPGTVRVRDSKRDTGPVLALAPDAWDAFVCGLKRGPRKAAVWSAESRSAL